MYFPSRVASDGLNHRPDENLPGLYHNLRHVAYHCPVLFLVLEQSTFDEHRYICS